MMRVHTVTVTSCYTVYATYQYGHLNYIIIYWSTGQGNRDSQDGTT